MERLESVLAEYPFFKQMKTHHLQAIAEDASNVRFDEGRYIFHEGEELDKFYLITRGRVALELHGAERGNILIQTIEEGELLGWSWLTPPYKTRFSARAAELTRAIAFDGNRIRAKCEQNHELGYELLKRVTQTIGQRLDATRLQLLDLYGIHGSQTRPLDKLGAGSERSRWKGGGKGDDSKK
jgi:CRP-like cAMP-binding protein